MSSPCFSAPLCGWKELLELTRVIISYSEVQTSFSRGLCTEISLTVSFVFLAQAVQPEELSSAGERGSKRSSSAADVGEAARAAAGDGGVAVSYSGVTCKETKAAGRRAASPRQQVLGRRGSVLSLFEC